MDNIKEFLESYVIAINLSGEEEYKFEEFKIGYDNKFNIIRKNKMFPSSTDIYTEVYNDDINEIIWLSIWLQQSNEKKKIREVDKFFFKQRDSQWLRIELRYDKQVKYTMRFENREQFLSFFNQYIIGGSSE